MNPSLLIILGSVFCSESVQTCTGDQCQNPDIQDELDLLQTRMQVDLSATTEATWCNVDIIFPRNCNSENYHYMPSYCDRWKQLYNSQYSVLGAAMTNTDLRASENQCTQDKCSEFVTYDRYGSKQCKACVLESPPTSPSGNAVGFNGFNVHDMYKDVLRQYQAPAWFAPGLQLEKKQIKCIVEYKNFGGERTCEKFEGKAVTSNPPWWYADGGRDIYKHRRRFNSPKPENFVAGRVGNIRVGYQNGRLSSANHEKNLEAIGCNMFVQAGVLEMKKPPKCETLEVQAKKGVVECLAEAAIGATPIVGDMYSYVGLLKNSCSGCKPAAECNVATGAALANKVNGEVIGRATKTNPPAKVATYVAKKLAMKTITGAAKYAGPAGMALAFTLGFADCMSGFMGKLVAAVAKSCIEPSFVLAGAGAGTSIPLAHLTRNATLKMYSANRIINTNGEFTVEPGKSHNGHMLGWAFKQENVTAPMLRFFTKDDQNVTSDVAVTEDHYLWIQRDSALVLASAVNVGDFLPTLDDSDQVRWTKVVSVLQESTIIGKYDPLLHGSNDEVGDMIIGSNGLIVPIYAGGSEFVGLRPDGDHKVFQSWIKEIKVVGLKYPCLFEEANDPGQGSSGLEIVRLMRTLSEEALQDHWSTNQTQTAKTLSTPQSFFEALKVYAPQSIALQVYLQECPELVQHLGLQNLTYIAMAGPQTINQ